MYFYCKYLRNFATTCAHNKCKTLLFAKKVIVSAKWAEYAPYCMSSSNTIPGIIPLGLHLVCIHGNSYKLILFLD